MVDGSVLWAEESSGEDGEEADTQAHGEVDGTFAERRLRRWIKGMFGGTAPLQEEPGGQEPDRDG
jgi:hypothetical protein